MTSPFTLEWTVQEQDAGKTVKQFLQEKSISKAALTEIKFNGGDILVNGGHVTVRNVLNAEETITVIFPDEEVSPSLVPENLSLAIVYEDDYLLVVNKPPFMSTIPSREHPTGSLANGLMGYYETIGLHTSPHIVTRLDRNTSGLVLIAKHRHIHHLFSKNQREGTIKRGYEAFVEGPLLQAKGTIKAPIGRKAGSIIERAVLEGGQYACTHFEVIENYPLLTHIKLQLETGRTHQIRVHMANIGHPLLGDDLYGGKIDLIQRHALHCKRLSFVHPMTKAVFSFTAELTEDMERLIR
ncbi:RluA family pseudouridine synthase [Caldibacillus lycopersici]|uniref:Pseudouridine synthase n=1 Tax=Perspicuibacillus lycopersici TaxID=1325689 RepID=A0AAE3IQA4_9BACI|nr:RluA family pseudouridine synthase [Perspicuibacillus lycopersici]MCU9612427.1 RluA family pseudouridine synthase [Perspicuibacillus lycopersici]